MRYVAALERTQTARMMAAEFVDDFFGGSLSELVLSVLDARDVTAGDLQRLRQLLDDHATRIAEEIVMKLLEVLLPAPHTVLYLANIALGVVLACAAAALAALFFQRRSAPTGYGLLLLGLVLVLTSPALVWLAGQAGIGRLQVTLGEERDSIDAPRVVPEVQRPTVDVRQEPQVLESEKPRQRPVIAPEGPASLPDARMELPVSSPPKLQRPVEQCEST